MVQEIHQVLMDREDTCHRTCFSLHLDGNMLDHFSELRSVEGLQEGSVLRVVEGLSGNWAAYKGGHMEAGPGSTLLTLAAHRQACGGSGGNRTCRGSMGAQPASQAVTCTPFNFTA